MAPAKMIPLILFKGNVIILKSRIHILYWRYGVTFAFIFSTQALSNYASHVFQTMNINLVRIKRQSQTNMWLCLFIQRDPHSEINFICMNRTWIHEQCICSVHTISGFFCACISVSFHVSVTSCIWRPQVDYCCARKHDCDRKC